MEYIKICFDPRNSFRYGIISLTNLKYVGYCDEEEIYTIEFGYFCDRKPIKVGVESEEVAQEIVKQVYDELDKLQKAVKMEMNLPNCKE